MLIPLSKSNIHLAGKGMDSKGNSILKLCYPNSRPFSIQTLDLPNTHNILTGLKSNQLKKISAKDLAAIEKEVIFYVKKYGSDTQKKKLKTY